MTVTTMLATLVYLIYVVVLLLTTLVNVSVGNSGDTLGVERHVELGRLLTSQGQFTDALTHFHAAVEGDPNNYLTYFWRATVYLALGKSKSALPDLDAVIQLKPDFVSAWIERGNLLLKQGKLDEAHINFETVLRQDGENEVASQQYGLIERIKRDIELAYALKSDGDCNGVIQSLSQVLEICPWDAQLRELRANCYIQVGELMKGIYDLKSVAKLRADSTETHHKLSRLHYQMGDADDSLIEIRECLKLDADHKECFVHYKKVKKLVGLLGSIHELMNGEQWEECKLKAQSILSLEKDVSAYQFSAQDFLCQCESKAGNPIEAIKACTEALRIEETPLVLCHRAEAHIANEDYDEALSDYQKALNMDENSQCATKGVPHVKKLQKISSRRDYYKILGVKRTASKKEINKAYRKLAQKWHPDGYQGEEKKAAEKKFIDIAAAKEVLTDPEKRQKFDNGEDPLDPESQQSQGFNPFAHGFHPFGGGGGGGSGPFQFRFHFT